MISDDAEIKITYKELEDVMANCAVELAHHFYEQSGNDESWRRLVLDVTAMFAGDFVKVLFKDQLNCDECEKGEDE